MSLKRIDPISKLKAIFTTGNENVRMIIPDSKDKLEVVIINDKVNEHYIDFINSKYDYSLDINDTEKYNIRKDSLYKMELTFKEKILNFLKIKKIREKFIVFFDKGNSEPKLVDTTEPRINSKIVYIAINAKVTTKGIASLFKEGFNLPLNAKTFIMIAVIAVIGIVLFYGYQQGWFANILSRV